MDHLDEVMAAFANVDNAPHKVAIVGSRDFPRPDWVKSYVARMPDGWTVVSGGARGVDTWAEDAARARGLAVEVFPANWERHGKAAGPLRNRQIVDAADWVVAFWDGRSRGTASTMALAKACGKLRGVYKISNHHEGGGSPSVP